ncbi:hypothetical protein L798_02699 [Zootermopsis nevadensis]|uniref:Histone-lysine N-methyltransferase SETMAR n=1 Tax=Zootermopsis nevadensis TaxID=136037 RepID=A0A067RD12_ZOONE|nr:hypothetical protein L798_02699 [Zootermopsis nevadensis]
MSVLRRCRWEVLYHPPHSPDLSPCDCDLIPKLKQPLCTREDISNAVRREMARFGDDEADGIRPLPRRWQGVLDTLGD